MADPRAHAKSCIPEASGPSRKRLGRSTSPEPWVPVIDSDLSSDMAIRDQELDAAIRLLGDALDELLSDL
jgi:hypothetical protein